MNRTCSPDDEWVGDGDKRCGMKFDDSEKSTICPHPLLPGSDDRRRDRCYDQDAERRTMKNNRRQGNYVAQNGSTKLTAKQKKRMRLKENKEKQTRYTLLQHTNSEGGMK